MNILLLGNGFDLYYRLPTKYQNFLHTVDFLVNNYSSTNIKTVGDVFSNLDLQKCDSNITESYNKYSKLYNETMLDSNSMEELIACIKDNVWFRYLLKSFDKDVGWIDFEQEISTVINAFKDFFIDLEIDFNEQHFYKDYMMSYIIKIFNFFYIQLSEYKNECGFVSVATYSIKDDFVIEYPLGSQIKKVNTEKIIKELFASLKCFTNALRIYLKCFIDCVFDITSAAAYLDSNDAFLHNDYIVTLNYTNTFEKLYLNNKVFHLHGNVNENIVLGINADDSDELTTLDTSFVAFKKYYQRTMLETDCEYLRWYQGLYHQAESNIHILVMGHSLDITDKDIIEDLFKYATKITILYHNDEAKASYITNLIKIFGKSGFDILREEQKLAFLPLYMDFSEFSEMQAQNSLFNTDRILAQLL